MEDHLPDDEGPQIGRRHPLEVTSFTSAVIRTNSASPPRGGDPTLLSPVPAAWPIQGVTTPQLLAGHGMKCFLRCGPGGAHARHPGVEGHHSGKGWPRGPSTSYEYVSKDTLVWHAITQGRAGRMGQHPA